MTSPQYPPPQWPPYQQRPPWQQPYPQQAPYPPPYQQQFATRTTYKQRTSTNHVFHLLMTVLTFGLWGVLVWLPITIWHKAGPRRTTTERHR